jgi:hypothetical protein
MVPNTSHSDSDVLSARWARDRRGRGRGITTGASDPAAAGVAGGEAITPGASLSGKPHCTHSTAPGSFNRPQSGQREDSLMTAAL